MVAEKLLEAAKQYEAQSQERVGRSTALVVQDSSAFSCLMDTARFEQLQRVAKIFAESKMIPTHFQKDLSSVFVVLQMAMRLDVDPMMMLQHTYMIQGKPGMESKLVIALINARGPFKGPIQWRFIKQDGSEVTSFISPEETPKCRAFAVHKVTGETCEVTLDWSSVVAEGWAGKNGSKWKSIPDMMFRYRTGMFLGRLYCPETTMGLPTVEELEDIHGGNGSNRVEVSLTPTAHDKNLDVPNFEPLPVLEAKEETKKTNTKKKNTTEKAHEEKAPPSEPEPPPVDNIRASPGAIQMLREAAQVCGIHNDKDLVCMVRTLIGDHGIKTLEALTNDEIMTAIEKIDKRAGDSAKQQKLDNLARERGHDYMEV